MQVFEFYFNPKVKADLIFESFCYEPENIYQKRVGSLYMVGSLNNAIPKSYSFLDRLSKVIKDKYYSPSARSSTKSLKESLKRCNQFLQDLVTEGQISWLGNLDFIVFSAHKNKFNFSKVGDLKIFLLRKGKIINVEEKIKTQDIDPYPLKVFLNIVSGKLKNNDIIFILTKELAKFFEKESILEEIAEIIPFDEKGLISVLNSKKEDFEEVSGVCLALLFDEQKMVGKKRTILTQPKTKDFSFKKAVAPLLNVFRKLKLPEIKIKSKPKPKKKEETKEKQKKIKIKINKNPIKLKIPSISLKIPKIKIPKLSFNLPNNKKLKKKINMLSIFFPKKLKEFLKHKNTILFFSWVLILSFGFLIFQGEAKKELEENQIKLIEIEEEVNLAESLLILETPQSLEDSEKLLNESLEQIELIIKVAPSLSKDLEEDANSLKQKIIENISQFE